MCVSMFENIQQTHLYSRKLRFSGLASATRRPTVIHFPAGKLRVVLASFANGRRGVALDILLYRLNVFVYIYVGIMRESQGRKANLHSDVNACFVIVSVMRWQKARQHIFRVCIQMGDAK